MKLEHKNEYFELNSLFRVAYEILNRDNEKCIEHGSETDIPIEDRYRFVFDEYVKKLDTAEIQYTSETIEEIESNLTLIVNASKSYLLGNIEDSLNYAETIFKKLEKRIVEIKENAYFYRARATSFYQSLDRKEMFHIPFNKRYLIGNQRYSTSGIPCLYLGESTYICWEELGRPNPYTCNFISAKNIKPLKVLDMTIPSISESSSVSIIPIILSSCLSSRKNRVFKQEYILPQLIMYAIIKRNEQVSGIKYHSTSLFYSDFPFYSDANKLKSDIEKHNNYVFPALNKGDDNDFLSDDLVNCFHTTNTFSIWQHQLVSSKEYMPIPSGDGGINTTLNYLDNSAFGQLDRIFKKNDFASLRQDITGIVNTMLHEFDIRIN